jgi:2-isopropylmalate synthase
MRKALRETFPEVEEIRLTDYKVRVVDEGSGTAATVRVLIDSSDGESSWTTVGSSTNIIEASWLALADSLEYGLQRAIARRRARLADPRAPRAPRGLQRERVPSGEAV